MATALSEVMARYLAGTPAGARPTYRSNLEAWFRWCADNGFDALHAERWQIEAFCGFRHDQLGNTKHTVNGQLSSIRCFYRYLEEEGFIDSNPAEHARGQRVHYWSDGSWLTEEEAREFLRLAEQRREAYVYGACCLMLLNGTRVRETLALDVTDRGHVGVIPTVHLRRKLEWMQTIAVSSRTDAALDRAAGRREAGPLFVWRGKRVTSPQLGKIVVELGEQVGADRRITNHSLRRTFATLSRKMGVPDRQIMVSGGWSSRSMIDYYDMSRMSVEENATFAVSDLLS